MTVRRLTNPADLAALPPGPTPPLGAGAWAVTRPDAHLAATDARGLVARASVWWRPRPTDPEHPGAAVGMIGHLDASGDGEAAAVLDAALDALREHGCTRAVGPMDGSPWHAYRVVLGYGVPGAGYAAGGSRQDAAEAGGDRHGAPGAGPGGTPYPVPGTPSHPPFALEPSPPAGTERWLRAAGFETVETYHSALVDGLPDRAAALRQGLRAAQASDVTLRPFDPARAEAELDALYRISLDVFARNPFYVPIPPEAFLATYRPLVSRVDPRLVVVAERGGETVGICFGLPDAAQAARGAAVDTVIVKTVAVAREASGAGLGGLLVLAVEEAARRAGLSRSIHALMHDGNLSVRISAHRPRRVIRRYALLGRAL